MIDKKGSEDIIMSEIVFLIVVIIFFTSVLFFVQKTASGATFNEELTAKKIALLIDGSDSGTLNKVDISELYEIYGKSKKNQNVFFQSIVYKEEVNEKYVIKINEEENYVFVSLNGDETGFKYYFLSEDEILSSVQVNGEEAKLFIEIK